MFGRRYEPFDWSLRAGGLRSVPFDWWFDIGLEVRTVVSTDPKHSVEL